MAASEPVLFANLLSQSETLTMANLQLQHVVNSSKKLRSRQEILAKQQELRIKELEASIETQAAENSIWATQVDQILVTVNRQIEKALASLRARSAGDREALLPRSTPATINEQRTSPAPRVYESLISRLTTTSKDRADMNPTHRAILLEEAVLDRNPDEKILVQHRSAVHANTKSSMRADSAPFIPSDSITKVTSPANVFRGSLKESIHAVPLIQRPSDGDVNTSIGLNPTAGRAVPSYDLNRHLRAQYGPAPQATLTSYDDPIPKPNQINDWLEGLTPPSRNVERAQWRPMLQLSSTVLEYVEPNTRSQSLGKSTDLLVEFGPAQSKPHIHPEGSQVESYSSAMLEDRSKTVRNDPLSSVIKAGQSIHAPPPLVSNDISTDRPVSTQVSSLNLPQATANSPISLDSVNIELSEFSHPQQHCPLISVELPKDKEDRGVTPLAGRAFGAFSSLLDNQSEVSVAFDKSMNPGPLAVLMDENLAQNSSTQSPTRTFTSLTHTPAEPSPEHTEEGLTPKSPLASRYENLADSEPSSALNHRSSTPSKSSSALTYHILDKSIPSHILFGEMISASKAFSEKTEAQRKAAIDKRRAENEAVEEGLDSLKSELSERLKPTFTRVLGSALDASCKELVLKPSPTIGRLGFRSQPANRPLHLKFERVMLKLLLPSGAIKRLGHLDRPAMANAEICMHMYISEKEATSITLVAQIHSTGNDFLVLTATQARPLLEFTVNFTLPGRLNADTMTFNTVHLNEQDDFSATSSVTSEIENLREPITQRLKGSLRHMSFAFSHDDFNMLEQEDLPNVEDYQEFTSWDPEALEFFDVIRSFNGPTRKVVTMLFTDEKNSAEDVDDMITSINRNSRKKRVWRDNGVMWEVTEDVDGNEKWTLASHVPNISKHL
ncbi:hypothetical protein MMC29_003287 [Sticta canariensis]|nr:hypothetical protein [Sticta canariensis]